MSGPVSPSIIVRKAGTDPVAANTGRKSTVKICWPADTTPSSPIPSDVIVPPTGATAGGPFRNATVAVVDALPSRIPSFATYVDTAGFIGIVFV